MFGVSQICSADEVSDLKEQMKVMQEQMKTMQRRMNELEARKTEEPVEKFAEKTAPAKGIEERVADLEDKVPFKEDFGAYCKDGICFTSHDKKFETKVGGRLNLDYSMFDEDSMLKGRVGKMKDDGEIRRARLYMAGSMYEDFIYKLELDFAGGNVNFKDAYVGMMSVPYLGTVRAGHFFEQFSLENLTNTNWITFMEASLPAVFTSGQNLGVGADSSAFDSRITWGYGLFWDTDNSGNITSNDGNFSSRVTALPWHKDDGKKLFHMGASYSYRSPKQNIQYRSKPETNLAPYFVDTGVFNVNHLNVFGAESAFVYGPASLQGEYIGSIADQTGGPADTYFQGLYLQASYFLTGESRPYVKSAGVFGRPRPFKNASLKTCGIGAWELAARYSWLDLKDNAINGHIMSDVTLGLNWYLNPNFRIFLNYVISHLNGSGDANIVSTRFQVDF